MDDGTLFVVGPDVRIWGTIKANVDAKILGFVDGGIIAREVTVEPKAMVIGDIVAHKVTVRGEVQGSIFADLLILDDGAHVFGDVYHCELDLRLGALFEGKSRRHERPKSLAVSLSVYDHSHAS